MITPEKMNEVFSKLCESDEITTKELKEIGFHSTDITNLVRRNILSRKEMGSKVKRGFYGVGEATEFFQYGVSISREDRNKSRICYHKCYDLGFRQYDLVFQLFYEAIEKKDYDASFEYLSSLFQSASDKSLINDCIIYLYLLSQLSSIPDQYKDLMEYLSIADFNDFILEENAETEEANEVIVCQNNIIRKVLEGNFSEAKKLINDSYYRIKRSPKFIIIRKLTQVFVGREFAKSHDLSDLILDIQKDILNKKVGDALSKLHVYLSAINRVNYEILFSLLIKICIFERNINYVMDLLDQLRTDELVVDVSPLLSVFEQSLDIYNIEKASLIFDIMLHLQNFGIACNPSIDENLIYALKQKLDQKRENALEKTGVVNLSSAIPVPKVSPIDYQRAFLYQKYEELQSSEDGIIILEPVSARQFNIEEFNQNYRNVYAFPIDCGKRVVIKKTKFVGDFKEKLAMAHDAYHNHRTEEAIELYRDLLFSKNTPARDYGRFGLSYLAQNNVEKAVLYLEIATGLSIQNNDNNYDFTDLIHKLTTQVISSPEDPKVFVKMEESDFSSEIDSDYGIPKINDVCILVSYQGMSLEEACRGLRIEEDDQNMIALLFARDCYIMDNMALGDQYLKTVEKAKNKTPRVKEFLEDVRRNKKFYKNRVDESYKPLLKTRIFN